MRTNSSKRDNQTEKKNCLYDTKEVVQKTVWIVSTLTNPLMTFAFSNVHLSYKYKTIM